MLEVMTKDDSLRAYAINATKARGACGRKQVSSSRNQGKSEGSKRRRAETKSSHVAGQSPEVK